MEPQRPAGESFREGAIDGVVFRDLERHEDARGWLMELYREDELPPGLRPVMAYLSETLPGASRGPHQHLRQTDCFAFVGPGELTLYLWDARPHSPTGGRRMKVVLDASQPRGVVVPPGVVHAYKNTGAVPAWVFNAPDALYAGRGRSDPVDEIRYEDSPDSPFRLD